jgi:hypothetical protein
MDSESRQKEYRVYRKCRKCGLQFVEDRSDFGKHWPFSLSSVIIMRGVRKGRRREMI